MNKSYETGDTMLIGISYLDSDGSWNTIKAAEPISLKDYSKAHPIMKQQYTYKDLEAAFKIGEELVRHDWHMQEFHGTKCKCVAPTYNSFEKWFESYKFEMA